MLENPSRSTSWFWLQSGAGDPAFNMAVDELLLESMPELGHPVLRFYGWTEAAATFGYFQHYAEVEKATRRRPLIRRPTGGGIVPHDADWTYSLAIPACHDWYGLRATQSYHQVHRWIQLAFERIGLQAELAPDSFKPTPGQCFIGHERSDLLCGGRKVAGAAQRRRKEGLLIQGSIQPPVRATERQSWETSMLEIGQSVHLAQWRPYDGLAALQARARQLAETKYSSRDYNEQR